MITAFTNFVNPEDWKAQEQLFSDEALVLFLNWVAQRESNWTSRISPDEKVISCV